jgi:hypothetical protein
MVLPDNSKTIQKIKRTSGKGSIHNLFIFNKSGICIYGLNLTNLYPIEQEQLISSYFTALMSFTKELIGDKIKVVEMGGNIKLVVFERENLYFILLCEATENLMLLEDLILKIYTKFRYFVLKHNIKTDIEYISDIELDYIVEDGLNDVYSSGFDKEKEELIKNTLKELSNKDEITGVILLTNRGKMIYSSLDNEKLGRFLKEIEFRVKICNNSVLKMFYTSKYGELIFSEYIYDLYIIILIFESKIQIGIAEFYLRKIVKSITQILEK